MKYLFFDTETSGFPPTGRLVSIAWQVWEDSALIEKEHLIVKPNGFIIPYEAERIHGISTEYALENGHDLELVLNKFHSSVSSIEALVAHNISFDLKMVSSEYQRIGLDNNLIEKKNYDTMKQSTNFVKIPSKTGKGYKWPRLEELYTHLFGKKFDNAHSADADVDATVECFFELKKLGVIK